MLVRKKINSNNSITIPRAIREEAGIKRGTIFEVVVLENGDLVLKKLTPSCFVCASLDDIISYKGRTFCKKCLVDMREILGEEKKYE